MPSIRSFNRRTAANEAQNNVNSQESQFSGLSSQLDDEGMKGGSSKRRIGFWRRKKSSTVDTTTPPEFYSEDNSEENFNEFKNMCFD